ncbi:hypothetical protein PLICRDRAFT_373426 [Plicaturopsis crispa FD-325 SS-3]|uniref:DUF6534 domain-containing protein n=1 Tax=Plicaturopsis crispa FD-325 SS-3 TaxID=944288 RepID=A0A0C9SQZ5_PLICR|nr:hypothetical protein PLICRDRAFT_373426 [Plicaturopsis crispa FD-325 SS-3]
MSSVSSVSQLPFSIDNTYGAIFIAVILSMFAFGMTNLQSFWYYTTYHDDVMHIKIGVALLWIIDALHIVFGTHFVYYYLVTNFAEPLEIFLCLIWSFKAQVIMNVIAIVVVQTFYCIRLLKLSQGKNRLIVGVVSILMIYAYAIAILESYEVARVGSITRVNWIAKENYLAFASVCVIDVLIAVLSCVVLARLQTQSSRTKSALSTLAMYVLYSGILTSICSLAAIIAYAAMPNNLIFCAIELVASKLYVNSYLALLNARNYLKTRIHTTILDVETSQMLAHNSEDTYRAGQRFGTEKVLDIRRAPRWQAVHTRESETLSSSLRANPSPSPDETSTRSALLGEFLPGYSQVDRRTPCV